jgi:cytochrome c5
MKKKLVLGLVVSVVLLMGAASKKRIPVSQDDKTSDKQASSQTAQATSAKKTQNDDRGAQLFETHCGRCHKPPEDLSPRVLPAVLSHMRTRAMLSRDDEELILKFLAP